MVRKCTNNSFWLSSKGFDYNFESIGNYKPPVDNQKKYVCIFLPCVIVDELQRMVEIDEFAPSTCVVAIMRLSDGDVLCYEEDETKLIFPQISWWFGLLVFDDT